MADKQNNALLDRLSQLTANARQDSTAKGESEGPPVQADLPAHDDGDTTPEIDGLLNRINNLAQTIHDDTSTEAGPKPTDRAPSEEPMEPAEAVPAQPAADSTGPDEFEESFFPTEPASYREAEIGESQVEELVLKYLMVVGEATGQAINEQIKLPYPLISSLLQRLKGEQLIGYKGMTSMNDYRCVLTDDGRSRARTYSDKCTYYGAAPVSLKAYCKSVDDQSLTHQHPSEKDLRHAFSDLLVNPKMFLRLGAAVNSGRGMFLFGFPGNGKTSIAERITKAFGETIWVPRAIGVGGEIIRVFDPSQHESMPLPESDGIVRANKADARWVRIRRPTIIVGGELTMDHLELTTNHATGINEAPIQLKSNCGTLVIDDFGRQRMTTDELLNRWIVPLEKRYDFLNLPSGT